jgi:hypothetical protein
MKKKQNPISATTTDTTQNDKLPSFIERLHFNILNLNNSKFFAGVVMIMLNVGSKFIPIQFSKSAEEYLKFSLSKKILVFAMAWMGTRDIYTAIGLTAVFILLSDYLFNEESVFCIVPHSKRILQTETPNIPTNIQQMSKEELNQFSNLLEKVKNIINTQSK